MKILQLCKKFPYPLKDGESIAINNLSHALVDLGCEVDLLAMNTSKHFVDVEASKEHLSHYTNIHAVDVDNRLRPLDALSNLVKGNSYHISRFESSHFGKCLETLLKEGNYDIIQMETLYLAPYLELIREKSNAIVSMRAHNVEHEIWERITQNTKFPLKKWYLSKLSKQLKNYEINNLNEYDFLIAITDRDLKQFKKLGYKNGAIASPVGLNFRQYIQVAPKAESEIGFSFIGSLDWMPNLNGLRWFISNVWQDFAVGGKGTLHIAGRNTPDDIVALESKNVRVHGEVPNAINFISDHDIMVVPLFSGSGMRVKILEGMALGKVIISSAQGLEGIEATSGVHVLIANNAEEFRDQMQWCIDNPNEIKNIGNNARQFAIDNFDCLSVARNLVKSYEFILSGAYASK